MAIEYLHIWPRHEFMLIALPNLVSTSMFKANLCCKKESRNATRFTFYLPSCLRRNGSQAATSPDA